MAYCAENKFDILLTIDKNLMHQQNLDKYPVTIVVLNSLSSKIEDLVTFIPTLIAQIDNFEKNRAYIVNQ